MSEVRLEIINDKKLNWSYVKKVTVKIANERIFYEAPISIQEITRIHFITGKLLDEYYSEDKK